MNSSGFTGSNYDENDAEYKRLRWQTIILYTI